MIRTWIGFAMMCVGMFMAILDVQVVAPSLGLLQCQNEPTKHFSHAGWR